MKFVFCTKEHWPGVKTSLSNLASLVGEIFPEAEIVQFDIPNKGSSNRIFKEMRDCPPTAAFLGGWDIEIRNVLQLVDRTKTKVILNWCSPLTQIELGNEIPQFVDVMNFVQMGFIDYVSMLLEEDAKVLQNVSDKFKYMPVYMNFDDLESKRIPKIKNEELECDLFCAVNPRKNILIQLMALIQFDKIKIKTNYNNPLYIELAKRILKNHQNVNYNWMSREQYLKEIQLVDFSIQNSLSEGFNYTAAEHMYYGVPVICSNALPFVRNKKQIKDLVVKNPTDASEITECIRKMVDFGSSYREDMGALCKELIIKENNKNKDILMELFSKIIEEK